MYSQSFCSVFAYTVIHTNCYMDLRFGIEILSYEKRE